MDDLERRAQELADKIVKEMSERDYRLNGSELGYALGYEIARLEARIEALEKKFAQPVDSAQNL